MLFILQPHYIMKKVRLQMQASHSSHLSLTQSAAKLEISPLLFLIEKPTSGFPPPQREINLNFSSSEFGSVKVREEEEVSDREGQIHPNSSSSSSYPSMSLTDFECLDFQFFSPALTTFSINRFYLLCFICFSSVYSLSVYPSLSDLSFVIVFVRYIPL